MGNFLISMWLMCLGFLAMCLLASIANYIIPRVPFLSNWLSEIDEKPDID